MKDFLEYLRNLAITILVLSLLPLTVIIFDKEKLEIEKLKYEISVYKDMDNQTK